MLQETSVEAYRDLEPTLARRERAVLVGLDAYLARHGQDPTSYEILAFMEAHNLGVLDVNSVRPRLTALKAKGEVWNPAKRRCSVTGKTALTWRRQNGRLF